MKKTTAGALMTSKILSVGPDWSVDRLMEFLTDNNISGAPVVMDNGTPIGVVSLSDIARSGSVAEHTTTSEVPQYYRRLEDFVAREEVDRFRVEREAQLTIRDIMTPMVFAVDEDATVQEVAGMMITGRIHRLFVRHRDKLTGIITSMDLLPIIRDM